MGRSPAPAIFISGNRAFGIDIVGSTATGNVLQGNYIGTDETGDQRWQTRARESLSGSKPRTTCRRGVDRRRNPISGNEGDGVIITGVASATRILGNYIGTNDLGSPLSNAADGVKIKGASGNVIGGTDPAWETSSRATP